MDLPRPIVRVTDAALHRDGGPVRVVVSRLPSPQAVAEALAPAGGRGSVEGGRLTAMTTPSRLVDAVGRALGRDPAARVQGRAVAEALDAVLDAAVAAWHAPPPDLVTPAGTLECHRRAAVMGVVNVTPDSFFDGGRFYDPASGHAPAVERGCDLAAAGADVIDVGGESTRPGAEPVTADEEISRALPVVEALAAEGITVSIDTRRAEVARRAVEAGAAIVNDVSGGALDPAMLPTVAELAIPYVVMHARGTPQTMQDDPVYDDVVAEVFDFLAEGLERAVGAGIDPLDVVIDPGIGFGKTVAHNLALLASLTDFTSLGRPLLVGTSRKSFLGRVGGGVPEDERLEGSLASAAVAVASGAAIVRVHDVAATVRAVRVADAIARGRRPAAEDGDAEGG